MLTSVPFLRSGLGWKMRNFLVHQEMEMLVLDGTSAIRISCFFLGVRT